MVGILGEIEGKNGAEAEALVQTLENEWEEAGALSVWRGRRLMLSFCDSFHGPNRNRRTSED